VRLEGFNANIFPILKTFDIFTLTSFHEGLPMSLLEAMAVGTPVISTNVGGIIEVIVDGESGFLVSNMNPTAFGDKIMQLYTNRDIRIKISNNGTRTVEEKFNVFKNNQLLEDLYKKKLT
jgi:glycosyltransferase involved in cell wall biosynthesis